MAPLARYFYHDEPVAEALKVQHLNDQNRAALRDLYQELATASWQREAIAAAIKSAAGRHGLKPPQVMMPLRVLVAGTPTTPAIDAVLALLGRETTRARLATGLAS